MRQITCPVCKIPPENTPVSQSIHLCNTCGVRWTYFVEEVDSEALYKDEVYSIVDNRKSIFERIIFFEAKKILRKAHEIHPNANSLLDFGSGKGQFLSKAKEAGWKGLGIETAIERATFAREKYQVAVLNDFYQGGKIQNGNFDFITLNHVLEHLPDPMMLLSDLLENNLAKDGLVYLEVPRSDSWQAKIAGLNWMHWDIPKHLTHWTEEGLEKEFSKIGFKKVSSRGFSVHLGVLGMLHALLSKAGYKENLILRLKKNKTPSLLLLIALFFPFAMIFELISSGFDKSGIFGIYLRKNG
ncbi:class I SAM-dependent methyltransferase [Algoriphagus sp. A40]|uniref:class I SAM-dependent methyltransferase n=1 Tax=Algoriphagus sp. A40 TaxID=1945863 RepID=UPI00098788C1|nr:class I SAM-dependent methyltransferase [Algoriphagus sp. A40]OOG70541.1 methyltransferase [Algoriphagus sp. A40]